jgi:hypothetical protein
MNLVRWSVALLLVASACAGGDSSAPCSRGCGTPHDRHEVPAGVVSEQVASAVLLYPSARLDLSTGPSAAGGLAFTVDLVTGYGVRYVTLRRELPMPAVERVVADPGLGDAAVASDGGVADSGADSGGDTGAGLDASDAAAANASPALANRIVAWITPVPEEGALVDADIVLCSEPGEVLRHTPDGTFECLGDVVTPARRERVSGSATRTAPSGAYGESRSTLAVSTASGMRLDVSLTETSYPARVDYECY